jgi:hypothetical protein
LPIRLEGSSPSSPTKKYAFKAYFLLPKAVYNGIV